MMSRSTRTRTRLRLLCLALALAAACGGTSASKDTEASGDATIVPDGGAQELPFAEIVDAASEVLGDAVEDASEVQAGDVAADASADVAGDAVEDVPLDVPVVPPPRESSAFKVRPTVEQVYVWNAEVGLDVEVVDASGAVVASGKTDVQGGLVLRGIAPGPGYAVRPAADPEDFAGPHTVLSVDGSTPPESFYASQKLEIGYGYITMRDGTKLGAFIALPGPPEDGPYPTVVNYSGYTPSRPGHSYGEQVEPFCPVFPLLCNAPNDPNLLIAGLNGFAVVGVNVRGTACSGGAYDYFEPLQSLDGYDVVETVAHQPWVKHGKVGMVGLSFPGIAQLFVGAQRPPSLAAIAPQSVIADSASSCLMPGGIYNDGFAFEWVTMVYDNARAYNYGWVNELIAGGDATCDENQKLHEQRLNAIAKALDYPYYSDDIAKPVDPSAWVDRIDVPVFLSGHWQDEQTGPHFAALLDKFTGTQSHHFVVTNGIHMDGFAPQVLTEWLDFLFLFVAREVPDVKEELRGLAAIFMGEVFGAVIELPLSKYQAFTDYASALAAWEDEPEVRVIFETGTDPALPAGAPRGTFDERYTAWPIPTTQVERLYFQPGGGLDAAAPGAEGGASAWTFDPAAGQRVILASGSVDVLQPDWSWPALEDGKAVAFATAPLAEDVVLVGSASVDLWIRVEATDLDLEVNLTEIRPDGQESYVQSGWLRASHRALRDDATELRPVKSHYEKDLQPLVPGEWTYVRVEVMPFGHAFRAGSRLRVSVDTPGDSRARWRFRLLEFPTPPVIEIGHDAAHPSSVALPRIPGVDVPATLPPCNAFRGQPCRAAPAT